MLYDPAPYNDPGDPGWDMSAYMEYNNGQQSFTYRRRSLLEKREARNRELGIEPYVQPPMQVGVEAEGRQLQSATNADIRNRMVFYTGDERAFYEGLDGTACEPLPKEIKVCGMCGILSDSSYPTGGHVQA